MTLVKKETEEKYEIKEGKKEDETKEKRVEEGKCTTHYEIANQEKAKGRERKNQDKNCQIH